MFFPNRIKSISENDLVLEIGPGSTPHPRSNIFLEKEFGTKEEYIAQSGHVGILETDKKIIYYKGDKFPFKDKEFDYVICSHVLEHVDDIPEFLSEIFRVGKKGYIEFPTIYYDYLHNIEEHLNMILYKKNTIYWCKKEETPIIGLSNFTMFFRKLQRSGFRFQEEINDLWHQGFEWNEPIKQIKVENWQDLTYPKSELENLISRPKPNTIHQQVGIKKALKTLLSAVMYKLKK